MKKMVEKRMNGIVKKFKALKQDEKGMELLQILIVCLLVVVLGGIMLVFFTDAFDELGKLMVNKIKTLFSL